MLCIINILIKYEIRCLSKNEKKGAAQRGVVGDNGNYQIGAYADMHCTKVLSGRQKVQEVGFSNLINQIKSMGWKGSVTKGI